MGAKAPTSQPPNKHTEKAALGGSRQMFVLFKKKKNHLGTQCGGLTSHGFGKGMGSGQEVTGTDIRKGDPERDCAF